MRALLRGHAMGTIVTLIAPVRVCITLAFGHVGICHSNERGRAVLGVITSVPSTKDYMRGGVARREVSFVRDVGNRHPHPP